nr:hypothetical protein [Paenibacillus sp. N3.4]
MIYLGPDTPEDGIRAIVEQQHIRVICLSLTNPNLMEPTFTFIDHIREACPELAFVLGGQGFRNVPEPYVSWLIPNDNQVLWERWFLESVWKLR